jgi:hypothetical protein
MTKSVAIFETEREAKAFKSALELFEAVEIESHGPFELDDEFGFIVSINDHADIISGVLDYRGVHEPQ